MSTLHPIDTMRTIRDTYLRYLKTIYPFQDQELQATFWHELEKEGQLVKGPLLESAPPFEYGRSIAQLTNDRILHSDFSQLCSDTLPWERPLYLHQDQAITHVVQDRRNLIVATGTGSGKTETFLIPILNHLLGEQEAGTLQQPGVRALLLYPMNALANDQLRRLRRVLENYPSIAFGRYTGETEEENKYAEERFYQQFPFESLLPNELISRRQMRSSPPHILLTNYAMLEYLLLRPEDCELFDGEAGKHWQFLVLDEAHTYDGASGIELAMLLRRLKDRVVKSVPGRLRCIATSATLGRGHADFPFTSLFASNLFGEIFEWENNDPLRQDVIEATRIPSISLDNIWGEGTPQLYYSLQKSIQALPQNTDTADAIIAPLAETVSPYLAQSIIDNASKIAREHWDAAKEVESMDNRARNIVEAFLFYILQGDKHVHKLHELLGNTPYFLDEIAQKVLTGDKDASRHLVALVDLAVRARPTPTSCSLLPARYHAFARALEGVFACLSSQLHSDNRPHIFLNRHKLCPECNGWVIELATCVRCGATYAVGDAKDRNTYQTMPTTMQLPRTLHQLADNTLGISGKTDYFLIGTQTGIVDEDEAIVSGDDLAEEQENGHLHSLCLLCGTIALGNRQHCNCGGSMMPLCWMELELKKEQEPTHCINCGARSTNPLIFRFLTGQDAPVSVLATALYQQLPPSLDPDVAELPGQGRKLLIFSDSRQDAAFFAPYLERTYNQVLHRRLILIAVLGDQDGLAGHLRLQDIVSRLLRQSEKAGIFTQSKSYDERRKIVTTWLMQELIALDRRLSLEGIGLLQFRLVRPVRWRPPAVLQKSPWNLDDDKAWTLIALLLNTLRQQSVTTFPVNVDPKDDSFAPRNKEFFVRKDQANSKAGILSWVPTRGRNRRQDLLERLLKQCAPDLSPEECKLVANDALSGLWIHLTEPNSTWHDHLVSTIRSGHGVVYRLSHEFWELVPMTMTGKGVYRCNRCCSITALNARRLCPSIGCQGLLERYDLEELEREENHYRTLYLNLQPIPLTAEEHTAQWTSDEAGKVQERFIRSKINVLSCSTTFELGVDVGELQAVLMRNVPPTTANYVQRAGRAGRRTDSAAFALTYAQRRSHDLTHYSHPQKIVAGKVNPPRITLENEKIVRRHLQAVHIAAFFRHIYGQEQRLFKNIGSFFQPEEGLQSGTALLMSFSESKPEIVQSALRRIVPVKIQGEVGVEDWSWLRTVDGDGMLDLLERVDAEVIGDLNLYLQMETEAARERSYGESQHYQYVSKTIRSRALLGFFASRNLLPKYGFPTDVVELKTDHLSVSEASKVQLERDLRIALAEYAPGAEVVAAKLVWSGGGLYKQPGKDWPTYHYAICPTCKRFVSEKEEIAAICKCGGSLKNEQRKTFLIPEFGFVAARNTTRIPGESRPQRLYSSRVYFAEYASLQQEHQINIIPAFELATRLSSDQIQISSYYSRFGKLALVNVGMDSRGFRICQQCGFAEMAPEPPPTNTRRRSSRLPGHTNPRTGKPCNGLMHTHDLGHEFLTDVVEIHFNGRLARFAEQKLWRSLIYALLEGTSLALSIRRDDLDGTLYWHTRGEPPAVVLFDNVPGGAGHVKRIGEEIESVFNAAADRVNIECCGPETSCYECLRNYRNQPYHEELQRGLVRDFLRKVLDAAKQIQ